MLYHKRRQTHRGVFLGHSDKMDTRLRVRFKGDCVEKLENRRALKISQI